MQTRTIPLLRCVYCKEMLHLCHEHTCGNEIMSGALYCKRCGLSFEIQNGIPSFILKNDNHMPQYDFWENSKVLNRRPPNHSVIRAFAKPKIDNIYNILNSNFKSDQRLSLLDIGSGNGYFSYYLQDYFDVTCLDFSRNILSVNPSPNKIHGSAEALPFKDKSFNFVFCANLLHHAANPNKIISEMARVGSDAVIIIEPNKFNLFMYLISMLSTHNKALRKFSGKYIRNLLPQNVTIIYQETHGFILPNITATFLLPLITIVEPYLSPKMYHLLIAKIT